MKKYTPLGNYLARQFSAGHGNRICLTFQEVERILGFALPRSAYTHRAWWSNSPSHPQACSWLDIGWKVSSVDIEGRKVTFMHMLVLLISETRDDEIEESTLEVAVDAEGFALMLSGPHASATSRRYSWKQIVQILLDTNPHMFGTLTKLPMHYIFPEMLARLGYSVVNWETGESWRALQ